MGLPYTKLEDVNASGLCDRELRCLSEAVAEHPRYRRRFNPELSSITVKITTEYECSYCTLAMFAETFEFVHTDFYCNKKLQVYAQYLDAYDRRSIYNTKRK